jgi:Na+/H+ antiporter NhaD/arsenite permease-like protein
MLIGTFSHLHYRDFAASLAPIAVAGLVVDFLIIAFVFRNQLQWPKRSSELHPRIRVHRGILIKSLTASIAMIFFFFAGADVPIVALSAAAAILITRRVKPHKIYREIDWELLTLFAGLFVVIGAVENSGLAAQFFRWAGENRMKQLPYFAGVVTILSNLVSNVPAVLIFKSFIPHLTDPRKAWLILAMSSTLAGNLTMLGSIANLIVVQGARHEVQIHYMDFLKVGIPLTLITILIGILWLL